MAALAQPSRLYQPSAGVSGRARPPYTSLNLAYSHGRLVQDFRLSNPTTGVIADRVMVKLTPSAPETPFANGRVWLLRLSDGYKAWEGWSDLDGRYRATGLELSVEYIAVGIDPYRDLKATGAGPVLAVAEGAL